METNSLNQTITGGVEFPPIVDFMTKLGRVDLKGAKKYNMVQAVPPYPTFLTIRQKLAEKISDESVSFYTDVPGLKILRDKIVEKHPLEGINSDQVMVTAGANNAMFLALKLLVNPGDEVGLLEPYYFNYDMALKMLNLKPSYIPLSGENGFQLDAKSLIAEVESRPHLKLVILITPNNPTGAIYSPVQIFEFTKWAESKGIHVVIDETYGSFDAGHLLGTPLASQLGKNLHLVGSFSKAFSLTGYRVGYFISGLKEINQAMKIQDTNIICASHIGQWAAYYGLSHCDEDVAEKVQLFRSYQAILAEKSKVLKKFSIRSMGAFFAYLEHPLKTLSSEEAALKLYEETGVMGLPGTVFGKDQNAYIRLAFCNLSEADLRAALDNIIAYDQRV